MLKDYFSLAISLLGGYVLNEVVVVVLDEVRHMLFLIPSMFFHYLCALLWRNVQYQIQLYCNM